MNINTNPSDIEFSEVKETPKAKRTRTAAAPARPAWIEENLAAAKAHNESRWSFIKGTPETVAESSRAVRKEMNALPTKIALAGCYLVFWGTAAAIAFGLFL